MIAAQLGRPANVRALLNAHADKALKDRQGKTAVQLAIENEQAATAVSLEQAAN
jgi:ankyrin repeat protein